eukprot:11717835-Alexandrium_andersonii.AAC.1
MRVRSIVQPQRALELRALTTGIGLRVAQPEPGLGLLEAQGNSALEANPLLLLVDALHRVENS